jgi:hypothetical protein
MTSPLARTYLFGRDDPRRPPKQYGVVSECLTHPNNVARKEVPMSPSSRNRQTFSKMTRERMVKERRAAKQEKKDEKKAAAAEALAEAVDPPRSTPAVDDEVSSGPAPDGDADGAGDRPG